MPTRSHPTFEERQARRRRADMVGRVAFILARFDPMCLLRGRVTDEYEGEASSILDRLPDCRDAEAVQTVVYEEFCRWFNPAVCGERSDFLGCSVAIWNWWEPRVRAAGAPAAPA